MKSSTASKRFYTWDCVSYLPEEAVKKLCIEQAKNWAYAYHDKDVWSEEDEKENPKHEAGTPKTPHFHILLCLEREKSFDALLRIVKLYGAENTRIEPISKDWIAERLEYMWHDPSNGHAAGKYQYDREIVKYSSRQWLDKYIKGEEPTSNDEFLDDLLAPASEFSVVKMARTYGRDFMKNFKNYLDFRKYALAEQTGVYVPEQYARDTYQKGDADYLAECEAIRKQNENINDFRKGKI